MSNTLTRTAEREIAELPRSGTFRVDAATCASELPLEVARVSDAIVLAREHVELQSAMAIDEEENLLGREALAPARIDGAISLLLAYQSGGLSIGHSWQSARTWGIRVTSLNRAAVEAPELGLSPDGRVWTNGSPTRVGAFAGLLLLGMLAILAFPGSGLVKVIGAIVAVCGFAGIIPPSPWRVGQHGLRASDVADALEDVVALVERSMRETRERATVRGLVASTCPGELAGAHTPRP